jgi:hypothetical protein
MAGRWLYGNSGAILACWQSVPGTTVIVDAPLLHQQLSMRKKHALSEADNVGGRRVS